MLSCHTAVSQAYGEQEIAKRLVFRVLEAAERRKIAVDATCSYALKMMNEI